MIFPPDREAKVLSLFKECDSSELKVKKLIELGRSLPPMSDTLKTEENRVVGCQSIVYLHSTIKEEKIYFTASSEALISSGLAALLIEAYSGLSPETILQSKPSFLEDLGIYASLSPGRSNGLSSMLLRMQKDALKSYAL